MEKTPKERLKWHGFDFDRTLAFHGPQDKDIKKGYNLGTGAPIQKMVDRLKQYLAEGKNCKIFTARVSPHPDVENFNIADRSEQLRDWCEAQGLPRLDVVCIKDAYMEEIWDDKSIAVEPNTGRVFSWNFDLISNEDLVHLSSKLSKEERKRNFEFDSLDDSDIIKHTDFYEEDSGDISQVINACIGITVEEAKEEFAMTNGFYRLKK